MLYNADRLPLPLLEGEDMELFPFFISAKYSEVFAPELPVLSLTYAETAEIGS